MKKSIFAAMAVISLTTVAVFAAVTFDPDTGIGFAGKGDVAAAMGEHEKNLEDSYTFLYSDVATYEVPCQKDGKDETSYKDFPRTQSVIGTVNGGARKNKQQVITGYNLATVGTPVLEGKVECPGGWEANGPPVLVGSSGGTLSLNEVVLWTAE
jgi:hypothetical protein